MRIQEFNELNEEDFGLIKPFFTFTRTRDVKDINTVVLHWTAGKNINSDIDTLQSKNLGYHFIITIDGKVYQGAPLNKVVSHGGASYGPNGRYVNGTSVGISFQMSGPEVDFTEEMYLRTKELILDMRISLPNIKYITGHHWVSPGRKIDPYTFDFDKLINMLDGDYELWKTEYKPFPTGLVDCTCIERDDKGNCVKSTGSCIGPGKERYSKRALSNEVLSTYDRTDLTST